MCTVCREHVETTASWQQQQQPGAAEEGGLEPKVKLEEEKVVLIDDLQQRLPPPPTPTTLTPAMTVDEKRFLDTCRSLGEKPNKKYHYGLLGETFFQRFHSFFLASFFCRET